MSDFDVAAANGLAKPVFGSVIEARPPKTYKICNRYPFKALLGEQIQEVVYLTEEWGVTFNSGAGTIYTLNDSVGAISKKLNGSGAEITLKTRVPLKLMAMAQKSGPKAFQSAMGALGGNMKRTMDRVTEIASVWGSDPLGIGQVVARTVDASTVQTFSISAASWAAGFWAGAEGMRVAVYNDDSFVTLRTADTATYVSAVTMPSGATLGTVTLTGTEAQLDTIVADDIIVPLGMTAAGSQKGLMYSAANAGTYLGIDGSVATGYSQWRGNSYAVGSVDLTWDKIEEGVGMAVGKGLEGDGTLYVSLKTWSNLNTDLGALRVIDSSYKTSETNVGTGSIRYHSHNGMVTVEPYTFMKQGSALFLPDNVDGEEYVKRIGSSDVTFDLPEEGSPNMRITDGNGVEFRGWTDQFAENRAPGKCVVFTGIVNS